MEIIKHKAHLKNCLHKFKNICFVPTMGAFHKGHISLIKAAKKKGGKLVVSIFVNPKQFNNKNDLKTYPRNIKKDLQILKQSKKVDFVYLPKFKDIYKGKNKLKIKLLKKDNILCAKFRKGHFEGVLNVMNRLTKIINPKKIFMGEKDFQQFYLVKNFLESKYETKIIPCKTIRNKKNVALSSRNFLLDKFNLNVAANIYKKLLYIKKNIKNKKNISKFLQLQKKKLKNYYKIKIDYLELRNKKNLKISTTTNNSRLFIAYYINKVRLIDNL